MKNKAILAAICLCGLFIISMSDVMKRDNYYQVKVKVKSGNCTTTKTYTVKAYSSYEAKQQAVRVAQYDVKVQVMSYEALK